MMEVKSLPVQVSDLNSIIRSYLIFYGYEETLRSFEETCGTPSDSSIFANLHNRKSGSSACSL